MKQKYIYYAEWFTEQNSSYSPHGPNNQIRFALDTASPEDAIKIILTSGIAHQQKGPLANFMGPQGTIYCD